ncbi:Crp/Fnr family transcriptional regulator [Nannocystis bainbridge]|uniref:Crp/Fnr family transcriptional regulator n=1 Tax=Nannocystis bainbridge TaxID=2995303 RepID=UPI00358DB88D
MHVRTVHDFFRRLPVGVLPPSSLAVLVESAVTREHPAGSSIHSSGDPAEHVYLIHSGRIAIGRRASPHRVVTIDIRRSGDVVGEGCLWQTAIWEDDAVVVAPVWATTFTRACFRLFLDEHPGVERALMEQAIAHRDAALRRTFAVLNRSVRARLAAVLLDMGDQDGRGQQRRVRLRQRELAALVGATRETIAVELQRLELEGFIVRADEAIVLRDIVGLRALTSDDADTEPSPPARRRVRRGGR